MKELAVFPQRIAMARHSFVLARKRSTRIAPLFISGPCR